MTAGLVSGTGSTSTTSWDDMDFFLHEGWCYAEEFKIRPEELRQARFYKIPFFLCFTFNSGPQRWCKKGFSQAAGFYIYFIYIYISYSHNTHYYYWRDRWTIRDEEFDSPQNVASRALRNIGSESPKRPFSCQKKRRAQTFGIGIDILQTGLV